jgi:hypothetical protein
MLAGRDIETIAAALFIPIPVDQVAATVVGHRVQAGMRP